MNLTQGRARIATSIAERLHQNGHTAYFAGGCVRDQIMNREAHDFDIATTATPDIVEKIFPKVVPVGRQFGVMIVVEEGIPFEVATFRSEAAYLDGRHPSKVIFSRPEEDARRRDFTVNGLFYDPFARKVVDFVGGQEDIQRKVIRAIGHPEERFEEDKLRLLRAIRFSANLGFEIEEKTWKSLKAHAAKITQVSPERIREELVKIFTRPGAGNGFLLLSESGLMKEVLPEIEAMKGVQQQPDFHPEGDVFIHTKMLLDRLQHPSATLALSALLHDVGKPKTFAVREGKITFYEHAPLGAAMAREILKRLRFSNQETDSICESVANHMKFADVQRMRSGKLKQFVSRPNFQEELELHKVDCQSSHGMLDHYEFLKKKLVEFAHEDLKPKPLVNGNDLIALGMKPGPAMKPLLEEIYELQLEGKFKSQEEALRWVRGRLESPPKV
ncbi:MAG: CCA tRNA nucleotidyltransferase [Candidatus Omnitrophica bacterium]|nr:CCA tRNA nucleotidyltransferase [Candidatus Omnitrophota bacterium]